MQKTFTITKDNRISNIYLDANTDDFTGLKFIAEALVDDIKLISDQKAEIITEKEKLNGSIILAGTYGKNDLIDELIANSKISADIVNAVKGKREVFAVTTVESPIEGVEQALVVLGSERLGTIYGMLYLSECMGVSPWVYWGDVIPEKKQEITLTEEQVNYISKVPSVKFRAFFMNDEWPSLGGYAYNTFDGFNDKFYEKVFSLLLRLKGNYFWPAMWSASFCLDGSEYPLQIADLAQSLGIYMGNSHHEPCMRASEEWDKVKSDSNDVGYGKDWNYYTNGKGLYQYWEDSIKRNKDYNNLITIGMRGERDTPMLGEGSDLKENIELLRKIISDQKEIFTKYGVENTPQLLALYKEVEEYYYGNDKVEGLSKWDALDNVILLLSDDNFGNVRTLPTKDKADRKAGWGLYYHYDYHGGPRSYEWVNTSPLAKTWEQVSMAYDYGIRDLWIVNVGDIRPNELPLSYFMDLAYDFETWGTGNINKLDEYLEKWVQQQFGGKVSDELCKGIEKVLDGYSRLNGKCKPETINDETFSVTNFDEIRTILKEAEAIEKKADELKAQMPAELDAAFYSLVYYPAVASVNVYKMNIYAELSKFYAKFGSVVANQYADQMKACVEYDNKLTAYYNDEMADGKWKRMMSSPHIGYTQWSPDNWKYPAIGYAVPKQGQQLKVYASESDFIASAGWNTNLKDFTNINSETYYIEVSNGGDEAFDYTVKAEQDFVILSKTSGTIKDNADVICVSIDYTKVTKDTKAAIIVEGAGGGVTVKANVLVKDVSKLEPMTFVEANSYISIEAEHYADKKAVNGVDWKCIKDYGKSLSSMKMYPTTECFKPGEEAPYMEYKVCVEEDALYHLKAFMAPTNNLESGKGLCYAVSIDGAAPECYDSLPNDYVVGMSWDWQLGVLNNIHTKESECKLTKGVHTIRFYGVDAGLVLQKLVLYRGKFPKSYFGPGESYHC